MKWVPIKSHITLCKSEWRHGSIERFLIERRWVEDHREVLSNSELVELELSCDFIGNRASKWVDILLISYRYSPHIYVDGYISSSNLIVWYNCTRTTWYNYLWPTFSNKIRLSCTYRATECTLSRYSSTSSTRSHSSFCTKRYRLSKLCIYFIECHDHIACGLCCIILEELIESVVFNFHSFKMILMKAKLSLKFSR